MTRAAQLHRDRGNPRLKFLDRYVGIPIVAGLGAVRRARGRRPVPADWSHVGLLVTAGIGDAVLVTGVMQDIRAARPGASITLFVTANNSGVAQLFTEPDAIVELPIRRPWQAVRMVREQHCDVVVDCGAWRRLDAVLAASSGARATVGRRTPGQHRHFAYDVVVDHRRDHELDNDRRLVAAIGVPSTSSPALPRVRPAAPRPHGPYAVFHLWPGGANLAERSWPVERWHELARALASRGLDVVLTGGPEDRDATDALAAAWGREGLAVHAVAGCTWPETIAWLQGARGVVSVNTGVMHVAAALGEPTLALNGPTSGRRWGPVGPETACVASPMVPDGYLDLGFERDDRYRDCMQSITLEMVVDAWDALVADPTTRESADSQ